MENNVNNGTVNANQVTNPQASQANPLAGTIFADMTYGPKWSVVEERKFTEKECAATERCEVVAGEHGLSVVFIFKGSDQRAYIALDKRSTLILGDTPRIEDLKLKTLVNVSDPDVPKGSKALKVDLLNPPSATSPAEATDFNNPFNLLEGLLSLNS